MIDYLKLQVIHKSIFPGIKDKLDLTAMTVNDNFKLMYLQKYRFSKMYIRHSTVRPNKKETRFISKISSLS